MLVFTRPGCEKGIEKLREIAEDIKYLNEKILPTIREAGIDNTTRGEIFNFSRISDCVKRGLSPREIRNKEFINYSGKCVFFEDKKFLSWYAQTDEAKENQICTTLFHQNF